LGDVEQEVNFDFLNIKLRGGYVNKLKEDLMRLAVQVKDRKGYITNEEMTKQSLIIPFLQVLGYDVFDPLEIRPEYTADFGKKKGEKVDYAIFKDGKPIIFIEAKAVNEPIQNHSSQLARYFNATPDVRIAIITNGIEYKFYTDLDKNHIMDEDCFYKFDISNVTDYDVEILGNFKKDVFEIEAIIKNAEELIYTNNLNTKLREIFKNPPDEFIRYLIKDFSDTRITSNVIDRFRPIVKKSISQALLDMVSQSLQNEDEDIDTTDVLTIENNADEQKPKKDVFTTQEELKSFEIIKKLLESAQKDTSELGYKDTISYFGVHNKHTHNWFIRLYMSGTKNIVVRIPLQEATGIVINYKLEASSKGHGDSCKIYIDSPEDLEKIKELIIKSYDMVMK
jgi:hypothetical protein